MTSSAQSVSSVVKRLQVLLRAHFGKQATSEFGECTLYLGPDKVDMTNEVGTIIARGPAHVATVLVRKRNRKSKITNRKSG
jgi:hypothetical protein